MRRTLLSAALILSSCVAVGLGSAAPAVAQTGGWLPGPGALQTSTYDGFVDQPSNGATVPASGSFQVIGWFVDTTAAGWAGADAMQVWLGSMDGGGRMIAQGSVAGPRSDVAAALANPYWAASGFSATVPGSAVPAGQQTLTVYVQTPGKGWWDTQVTVNGGGAATATAAVPGTPPQVTIISPTEGQDVTATGGASYTITGTATDPTSGPGAIDSVDVWIFGERGAPGATDLGTTSVDNAGNWSVTFVPTQFDSTHTNVYVYAHSRATSLTAEVYRGFNIVG